MCEIMQQTYNTWTTVAEHNYEELAKIEPVSEQFLTCKEQTSAFEYVIT